MAKMANCQVTTTRRAAYIFNCGTVARHCI